MQRNHAPVINPDCTEVAPDSGGRRDRSRVKSLRGTRKGPGDGMSEKG